MRRSELRNLGPILSVVALSLAFHFLGQPIFGDRLAPLAQRAEAFVVGLGFAGYVAIILSYALCSFFFVPLLIPLNVASGALYGPYVGTAVALACIAAGTAASAVSVRRVFTGMQRFVEARPGAEGLLRQVAARGAAVVLLVRLAFIVPYLWQNVVLALTPIAIGRLVWLSVVGSVPGAAVYSLLGAGLVRQESVSSMAAFLGLPLVLLGAVGVAVRYLKKRYAAGEPY